MVKLDKIPLVLLIISMTWSILLYITPATLAPGTVVDLDGNANMIDYSSLWEELPIPHNAVYYLGDLNCHQKFSRSYVINGNQMPVCSRDVGIFIGCNIGIALVFFVNTRLSPTRAFLNLWVNESKIERFRHRRIFVAIILIIFGLPLVLDGIVQGVTNYESTNDIRLLTGIIFGIMYAYGATVLMTSIARSDIKPAPVNLE